MDWSTMANGSGQLAGSDINTIRMVRQLTREVSSAFPINEVPQELVDDLKALANVAEVFEMGIRAVGVDMCERLQKAGMHPNGQRINPEEQRLQEEARKAAEEYARKTAHRPDPAELKKG